MQYCKNCGRQLKDGMRFCDRCGQSVRKTQESDQAARHREIKELQEERLNRKRRLAEKEERQQRAKENKRKNNGKNILIYILVVLLIAVASVLIGFLFASGGSSNKTETTNSSSATTKPYSTPVATETPVSVGTFSEITVGNVRCPYPSGFHSGTVSGNEKMNLTDPLGGAKMIIAQEAKGGDPIDLAKAYGSSVGASAPDDMRKGDDWYSVTATVNGTVHHRKCIIRNGLSVYYDFEYDKSSGSASTYESYIEEIDKNFK